MAGRIFDYNPGRAVTYCPDLQPNGVPQGVTLQNGDTVAAFKIAAVSAPCKMDIAVNELIPGQNFACFAWLAFTPNGMPQGTPHSAMQPHGVQWGTGVTVHVAFGDPSDPARILLPLGQDVYFNVLGSMVWGTMRPSYQVRAYPPQ